MAGAGGDGVGNHESLSSCCMKSIAGAGGDGVGNHVSLSSSAEDKKGLGSHFPLGTLVTAKLSNEDITIISKLITAALISTD